MDPSIAGQDPLQNPVRSASHGLSRNEVLRTVPMTPLGILDVFPTFDPNGVSKIYQTIDLTNAGLKCGTPLLVQVQG